MPSLAASGCELHYQIHDLSAPWIEDKQTILFHHGLGATSGTWAGWFPTLADRMRLVSFDMRGHGRSGHPPADAQLSLDLLAADIFAVADAAGADRFHLVGESIGGTIGLAATIARSDRIATLTVSNGAHLGATIGRVHAWKKQLDEGGSAGWSKAFMPDRFHADALSPERWQWFETEQARWPRDSILNALGVLIGADLTPRLAEIRCPTLLLHPDGSPFIPVPVMAELHRLLGDAQLNVIGHSRHGLPFSHAAQCAGLLRTFLDSHTAG